MQQSDVRLGSNSDLNRCLRHVRFTPGSGRDAAEVPATNKCCVLERAVKLGIWSRCRWPPVPRADAFRSSSLLVRLVTPWLRAAPQAAAAHRHRWSTGEASLAQQRHVPRHGRSRLQAALADQLGIRHGRAAQDNARLVDRVSAGLGPLVRRLAS